MSSADISKQLLDIKKEIDEIEEARNQLKALFRTEESLRTGELNLTHPGVSVPFTIDFQKYNQFLLEKISILDAKAKGLASSFVSRYK